MRELFGFQSKRTKTSHSEAARPRFSKSQPAKRLGADVENASSLQNVTEELNIVVKYVFIRIVSLHIICLFSLLELVYHLPWQKGACLRAKRVTAGTNTRVRDPTGALKISAPPSKNKTT